MEPQNKDPQVYYFYHWLALTQTLPFTHANQMWEAIFKWQLTGNDTYFPDEYRRTMYQRFKHELNTFKQPDPTYDQLSNTEREKLEYLTTILIDTPAHLENLAERTKIPAQQLSQIIPETLRKHPPRFIATLLFDTFVDYVAYILLPMRPKTNGSNSTAIASIVTLRAKMVNTSQPSSPENPDGE